MMRVIQVTPSGSGSLIPDLMAAMLNFRITALAEGTGRVIRTDFLTLMVTEVMWAE